MNPKPFVTLNHLQFPATRAASVDMGTADTRIAAARGADDAKAGTRERSRHMFAGQPRATSQGGEG